MHMKLCLMAGLAMWRAHYDLLTWISWIDFWNIPNHQLFSINWPHIWPEPSKAPNGLVKKMRLKLVKAVYIPWLKKKKVKVMMVWSKYHLVWMCFTHATYRKIRQSLECTLMAIYLVFLPQPMDIPSYDQEKKIQVGWKFPEQDITTSRHMYKFLWYIICKIISYL